MELQHPLRVVTSAVDGELLELLARADSDFTVSELHRQIHRSTEGVRRALERLTAQGIVRRHQIGRATSYRLNRDHLAAAPIIALAELPTTLRGRITDHIARWSTPPLFAALFGSAARGQMRTDSDIDIVLVSDSPGSAEWDDQVADLAHEVFDWTGNDARPLTYTRDEIRAAGHSEAVLQQIVDEGVFIAGDRAAFKRLIGA